MRSHYLSSLVALSAAVTLAACSGTVASNDGSQSRGGTDKAPKPATLTFGDGADLDHGTIVGFDLDMGNNWQNTDGSPSLGYLQFENAGLGCTLVLMVANPMAAFPHDMDDEAGSIEILDTYGPPGATSPEPYNYPTADGETVEMLGVDATGASGSRTVLAREFGVIDSALVVDLGCGASADIDEVLATEIAERFAATVVVP